MIKSFYDEFYGALNAIDEAISDGLDAATAYTRKAKDNGDHYSLKVDLPGFEKEEIEIEIINNILNLKAKSAEDSKSLALHIPKDIDQDAISSSLKNGQLTITLPKKPKAQIGSRKIKVT